MVNIKTMQVGAARSTFNVRKLVALQENYHVRSTVLFLARLAVATVFIYHGAGKLFNFKNQGGIASTAAFFKSQGVPIPHIFAYVGGITEFFGGLLLLVGLAEVYDGEHGLAYSAGALDILYSWKVITFYSYQYQRLRPRLIELAQWIAGYYLAPIGEVFRGMLPPVIDVRMTREVTLTQAGREAAACETSEPSRSANSRYGRTRRYWSGESAGRFTALRITPSAR